MENIKPPFSELFEQVIEYPDIDMQHRLKLLVGLDEKKTQLVKILSLLVNQSGVEKWKKTHHPSADKIINFVLRRPPLIVLAGDVGSGKSE